MPLFGKEKESIIEELLKSKNREVVLLTDQIEDLKMREGKLLHQVERLQEALIAVQSPIAYSEMKYDERTAGATAQTQEEKERALLMERTTRDWFQNLEGPTFKSADEMNDVMLKLYGDPTSEPIHPNEES